MTGERRDQQEPASYEFRIRGHLGATMLRAFPGLRAQTRGADTFLRGAVADQSALHGVLAQIEALGLELLGLRRVSRSCVCARRPGNARRVVAPRWPRTRIW